MLEAFEFVCWVALVVLWLERTLVFFRLWKGNSVLVEKAASKSVAWSLSIPLDLAFPLLLSCITRPSSLAKKELFFWLKISSLDF